jgi:DNA recombination protein RmuC
VEVVLVGVGGILGIGMGLLIGRQIGVRLLASTQAQVDVLRARVDAAELAKSEAEAREQQARTDATAQVEALRKDLAAIVAAETEQAREALMKHSEHEAALRQEKVEAEVRARNEAIRAMIGPVQEQLEKVAGHLARSDTERARENGELEQRLQQVNDLMGNLSGETAKLTTALRGHSHRGRWGELQLQRVVEMAGLKRHYTYVEQSSSAVDGKRLRPDMLIHLPDSRTVVIDSKAPMPPLDVEPTDEAQRATTAANAKALKDHIKALGSKDYVSGVADAFDKVIMFIPAESVLAGALEAEPALFEHALSNNVVLATPTTLLGLLTAIELSWRQQHLAENAQEIADDASQLLNRLSTVANHFVKVGSSLKSAVTAYNKAVGSFDTRLVPAARRMQDRGVQLTAPDLPELAHIDDHPRELATAVALPADQVVGEALVGVDNPVP